MKPIKCESCSKYYDEDKYDVCPHCNNAGAPTFPVKNEPVVENDVFKEQSSGEKKGLFSKRNKGFFSKRSNNVDADFKNDDDISIDVYSSSVNDFFAIGKEADTEKLNSDVAKQVITDEAPLETTYDMPAINDYFEEVKADNNELVDECVTEKACEEVEEPVSSLAVAIKQADAVNNTTDLKTVAFYNFSNDIEPVVGWLVCVKGEYKGESFSLKSGRNNIGRALTMDVALAQEKTVSRERHASITYDPQQKRFFVQSGESRGLTYLNNELLMTFKELKKGDVIMLGSCELLFYPLCGEDFLWDDYE